MGEEERIPGMPWDPNVGLSIGREEEGKSAEERKEPIGPTLEPAPAPSGAVTQMLKMSGTSGILQAPPVVTTTANTPQIPQHMPGIVRPANVNMNMPPGMPHGGMMMMQNMGRVGMGPLLGIPGQGHPHQFSQFSGPPPGRPPLLPNVPPPSMAPPPQMPPPPMHVVQPPPPLPEDEPAAKKAKTLEDSLIPEAQFLATNRSPATFIVSLPSMPEKPEMNLNGQAITITLPLNETVTTLKSRINDMIGLPLGKQKLRLIEGLFFKDGFSLAYYNVGEGATVHLSLKERGGRKK
jgi:splicing factor 3A subunit 1